MALWSVEWDDGLTEEQATKRFRTERNVLVVGLGLLVVAFAVATWQGLGTFVLALLAVLMAGLLVTSNLKMLDAKVAYMHARMRGGQK